MIEAAITRARRRFMLNEALGQFALAGLIMAAALSLLLIVGTRWLEWWTLLPVAVAALAYTIAAYRRAIPSPYDAAIRLDRQARLNDSLSTAYHFSTLPAGGAFLAAQRHLAEEEAHAVDVKAAIPLLVPRMFYGLAGMVLIAASLVAIRYGFTRSLDLRAPLTEVFFEDQAVHKTLDSKAAEREALRRRQLESAQSLLAKMGIPMSPEDARQPDALDKAIEQALEAPAGSAQKGQKGDAGKNGNGRAGAALDQPPPGDPMDKPEADAPNDDKAAGGKDAPAGDKAGKSKSGSNGENQSLLSKLKDAVSNMFSKNSPNSDQNAQKSASQPGGESARSDKAGSGKKGGKQDPGQNSGEAQDGEPNGEAQDGQQAQAKAGSKNVQQAGQAGSGAGSQDGAKELRAAEQLRAMGKISEIIGKRAATVSGETTIEVQSGNQQLRTAYSNKAASHNEAESDVSRDEIPVALQPYVREYFDKVRKTGPAKSPAKKNDSQ